MPLHPPLGLDRRDVPVSLTGNSFTRAVDRVGPRWNDNGSIGSVPADGVVGRVTVIDAIGRELINRGVDLVEQWFDL